MKAFLKTIKEYVTNNAIGLQSTLFLIFALISFTLDSDNKFWMFIIASIAFSGIQSIIDELKKLNKK
jgi:hypothetical protein|tara:strand:- start:1004 stop:1204 length:201 start_codon:yes stop_codon:yes gene_type:complete